MSLNKNIKLKRKILIIFERSTVYELFTYSVYLLRKYPKQFTMGFEVNCPSVLRNKRNIYIRNNN